MTILDDCDDNSKFIIVWGTAINGLAFTGPFNSSEEAIEYGEDTGKRDIWEVVELTSPEMGKKE